MTDPTRLRDHARGCEGRNYSCTCGYDDDTANRIKALLTEREADKARIAELEAALGQVAKSTGCCDACECWRKLSAKARATLENRNG